MIGITFKFKDLLDLLDTFPPMFVGGAVLGVFFGVILVFIYNFLAKIYKKNLIITRHMNKYFLKKQI